MVKRMKINSLISVLVLGCFLLPSRAVPQTTNASLVGDVKDATGSVIPDATIKVTNTATGVVREVKTGAAGAYRVFPLNPGTYDVAASATGFKTEVRTGVLVEVAANLKVDFTMEVGQITEQVEVTGAAPILQTQDASVGGTVTGTELARIPVNGRNYTRLILMMPGTSDRRKSQSRGTQSGTDLYSVNGARPQDNNYSLDGIDNNFMLMNSPGASPPMDSIQEFRVATNNVAEFGRSAGANVNIAVKSGTRNLHGTAYEYFRNDKLDANDFFANRAGRGKVPYRQNQYGLSLGGPVVIPKLYNGRDKTFWFVNWEGYRERRGNTAITNVPTPEQREGDFSTQSRRIFDPFTSVLNPDGTINRQPFPGNRIPKSMIHPSIAKFLEIMIPLPNGPGLNQNYLNTASLSNDRDIEVIRFDHTHNTNDFLSFRLVHQNVGQLSPQGNPFLSNQNRFDVLNYTASWNHLFGPAKVLEFRFGVNNPTSATCALNSRTDRPSFLDATGIRMFERNVLCSVIPSLNADGEFSAGGGGEVSEDNVYQFIGNYSQVIGSHSLKWGANFSIRHHSPDTANPPNGNADFNRELTSLFSDRDSGHSTATMLLGLPREIRRAVGPTKGQARQKAHQYYIQDDWRATKRLTVNLGLRYEFNNPPYDRDDFLGNLWITRDPQGHYVGNLMWAGINTEVDPVTGRRNEPPRTFGFGRSLMQSDKNDLAPRAGIAFQVNDKTVIRSGFGVFYNTTFMQEYGDLRVFWPVVPQQVFTVNNDTVVPNFFITDKGPDFSSSQAIGGWPQNPENRSPYSMQWNFVIQRQLMNDLSLEVGYVGSSSRKQVGYTAVNAPLKPGPGPIQPRRLLPDFGNIDGGSNRFGAKYNAMQLNATKRFSRGMQFRANYTWSKSMDDQSSLAEWKTQDPFNLRADWSRSSWDLKHLFQIAYVWELPFGRNKRFGGDWNRGLDLLLGNWSIEGYTRAQTGAPFNILSGTDRANVGRTYQRPDATCNPNNGPKIVEQWFTTSCFSLPAPFTYGNAGAYFVEGAGRHNWDLSAMKQFPLRERHRLEFRTEFFNISNTVKMDDPQRNFSSSAFGRVSSATPARRIQLALRYQF